MPFISDAEFARFQQLTGRGQPSQGQPNQAQGARYQEAGVLTIPPGATAEQANAMRLAHFNASDQLARAGQNFMRVGQMGNPQQIADARAAVEQASQGQIASQQSIDRLGQAIRQPMQTAQIRAGQPGAAVQQAMDNRAATTQQAAAQPIADAAAAVRQQAMYQAINANPVQSPMARERPMQQAQQPQGAQMREGGSSSQTTGMVGNAASTAEENERARRLAMEQATGTGASNAAAAYGAAFGGRA